MRRRAVSAVFLIAGLLWLPGATIRAIAAPFDDGQYRERGDRYYRDRDDYGRGPAQGSSPIDRVYNDVQRVASRARVDHHERDHFERALNELSEFQYRWRDGRFETRHLDRAIDNLKDLARADQVHPRDRSILARDIQILRSFRESRGRAYYEPRGTYGYRY